MDTNLFDRWSLALKGLYTRLSINPALFTGLYGLFNLLDKLNTRMEYMLL